MDMDSLTPELRESLVGYPAAVPPPGVHPNFVDPPSVSLEATVDNTICFVIATIAFLMRLYTKVFVMRSFDKEDSILYGVTIALLKTTILLQYLRIFAARQLRGPIYWICHGLLWMNIVFYIVILAIEAFPCRPVAKAWDPFHLILPDGSCINVNKHRLATSCVNVFTDFAIFFLPHGIVWKLNISRRRKFCVSALFAVGFIACATSVFRLYYAVELLNTPLTGDQMRSATNHGFWLAPEIACGVLVATLPVAPRFYRHVADSRLGETLLRSYTAAFRRTTSGGRRRGRGRMSRRAPPLPPQAQRFDSVSAWINDMSPNRASYLYCEGATREQQLSLKDEISIAVGDAASDELVVPDHCYIPIMAPEDYYVNEVGESGDYWLPQHAV